MSDPLVPVSPIPPRMILDPTAGGTYQPPVPSEPDSRQEEAWDHWQLGQQLLEAGLIKESIQQIEDAIRLDPKIEGACRKLAWILATCPDDECRNGAKAKEMASRACIFTNWEHAYSIEVYAAACAECGDFSLAVESLKKAKRLYAFSLDKQRVEQQQRLYNDQKPFRDTNLAKPEPEEEEE